MIAGVSAMGTI